MKRAQAMRGCLMGDIVAAGALKEAMRIIDVANKALSEARAATRRAKASKGGLAKSSRRRNT